MNTGSRSREASGTIPFRPTKRSAARTPKDSGRHARFHSSPRRSGPRRHVRRRHHRVLDVPLRRRPRQPDRLDRYFGGRARDRAQIARPRRSRAGTVRALFRRCRAIQVRRLLPVPPAGLGAVDGAYARDTGACDLRDRLRDGVRHPDGRLFGAQARHGAGQTVPGRFACRHLAADFPDRHSSDLSVRGDIGLVALVRPRRGGQARLVDDGPAHAVRTEGIDHALDHTRPVPDDPDHATGARGDAGSAADRLYPLRPRED